MKRIFVLASLLAFTSLSFMSCRDQADKETVVKEVRVEKESAPDTVVKQREGVLERTAKEVDKEVNKKIDSQIEKIGDDN